MKSQNKWHPLRTTIFAIACMSVGFGSVTLLVSAANRAGDRHMKEVSERISKQLSYNIVHPYIVGTNENGEIIKRYVIPIDDYHCHYVYEVGGTKTTNNDLGKAGLEVIVEKP